MERIEEITMANGRSWTLTSKDNGRAIMLFHGKAGDMVREYASLDTARAVRDFMLEQLGG